MAFRFDKLTIKAQEALQAAQSLAADRGHPEIDPIHLLVALLAESEGAVRPILERIGVNRAQLERIVQSELGHFPRVSGGAKPQVGTGLQKVLETAQQEADGMKDEYVSTEHLLVAMAKVDSKARNVLKLNAVGEKEILQAMQAIRGSARVTDQNPEEKFQALRRYGIDLVERAHQGKLDPVIGRDQEIRRVIQVLSRRTKNNPVLIGEPGVGKTAVVEGFAQRIAQHEVPELLKGKQVFTLDLAALVAGSKYRGEFEERLKKVMKEIRDAGDIVIFIDELHNLIGAGAAEGAIDAASILKPALARGELQTIGATTLDEYRKYIESDAALERRFQPILVEEPSIEETIQILRGVKTRYEDHHKLSISDEALTAAAQLAARYVPDRFMPDKAIDLIDEAGSRVRMYKAPYAANLRETFMNLKKLQRAKEEALETQRFDDAIDLRYREVELEAKLNELREGWNEASNLPQVTPEDIAEVVSMWTGVPVSRIAGEERERLLEMEQVMRKRVIGQEEPIRALSRAVRRARAGLKDPRRPIGSFIFLGPTGVGKTLLAKTLAEFMFGSEEALIKLDMSEFMERHNVSRLVGAPPGYVGYEEGGQLTEAVRRRPYSVILLDEVEKAHPEAFNMLLQIMEDGYLSDAKGRRVDFRNTLILMTSNIGAKLIQGANKLGFAITKDEDEIAREHEYESMKAKVMDALKKTFRPEFLNRLDGVMVFRSLSREEIALIVELELKPLRLQLAEQEITLTLTEAARHAIAGAGYDPEYGARPLRRVIQNRIQDPLSESLLANKFVPGDTVQIDYRETTREDETVGEDFVIDVIDHADVDNGESETAQAVEAMLQ